MSFNIFKNIVSKPLTEDIEHQWMNRIFQKIVQILAILSVLMLVISFIQDHRRVTFLSLCSLGVFTFSNILITYNHIKYASIVVSASLMILGLYAIMTGDGIHDTAIFLFPPFFLISSFMLDRSFFLILSFLTLTFMALIGLGELNGHIVNKFSSSASLIDIFLLIILGSATVLISSLFSENLFKVLAYAHKNAQNYRKIFNSIGDAILIRDRETGTFVHANETMLSMFGYTAQEVPGLTIEQLCPANEDTSFTSELIHFESKNGKGQRLFSSVAYKKNGDRFRVEVSLCKAMIDDRDRLLIVIRNIEAKRVIEERIKQNEKLTALGRLAGGIAHDFRNQLTGILGCSELLKTEVSSTQQLETLNLIIQSAKHSAELTQQLLFFARKGESAFQDISMNNIAESTFTMLQRSFDKRIELKFTPNLSLPLFKGDPGKVQNALLNLCINSRDAMPEGGILTIRVYKADLNMTDCALLVDPLAPGKYLAVSVSDTGEGIPPENFNNIFEPFFTTKPIGKGTGMGLAAVYGTIREHGGSISLHSKKNEGTTFVLYFPLIPEAPKTPPIKEGSPEMLPDIMPRLKTIVVDDDPIVRLTICKLLSKLGIQTTSFGDGISAVDFYSKHHDSIDIIFLDMNMPLINGTDTLKKLRKINSDVTVFIISGCSDSEEFQKISEAHVSGFIKKPFQLHVLSQEIQKITQQKSAASCIS
ncbi:MAG: response regulator [Chitinispirillaceae bacterium]|nr:response regulator [Chitinispirillaceae bacterium]